MPAGVDVLVECSDGYPLTARVFRPDPDRDRHRTAVIAPATGAKASYYWRYASFLATTGIRAVVADYRGIGRSAPSGRSGLRRLRARWHQWGTLDLDALIGWALADDPTRQLVAVGHSFGGLAVCLAPRAASITRLLMVGAQHAHWPDYAARQRLGMVWRWHIVMPAMTAVLGYFPGRRLGWVEDLPRGVAFDWARGSRDLARTIGDDDPAALARAADLTFEVLAVAAADDPFATERATDRALGYLPRARIERTVIDPAAVGSGAIGHLGLFHDRFRHTWWPSSAAWLHGEKTGPRTPADLGPATGG